MTRQGDVSRTGTAASAAVPVDERPWDAAQLRHRLAQWREHRQAPADGGDCAHPPCPGWESLSAPLDGPGVQRIGTLRDPAVAEPTLEEHHPHGTHYWSAQAPIATRHFPYNRCDVWQCMHCGRGFLQYTEYGGYYVDHRVREIDPELIC